MPRLPAVFVLLLLLLVPLGALAHDFPKLKPGLWEISNTTVGRPGQAKSSVCLDAALQRDIIAMSTGMMHGMCSKHDLRINGNKVTGDVTCKMGESTMKSRSVMTMTGDTAYRTEAHTTFDPPFAGVRSSDNVIEGRYVSACKPGQRPGDMTMPTGQTINLRTFMSGGRM
jgi:Protein of unknown function (DUF3617)